MNKQSDPGLLFKIRRGWRNFFNDKALVNRSDEILDQMVIVTEIARTKSIATTHPPRMIRRKRINYQRPTGHMIGDLVGNQDWKRTEASDGPRP